MLSLTSISLTMMGLVVFIGHTQSLQALDECPYWKNLTESKEYELLPLNERARINSCLYSFLLKREIEKTHLSNSLIAQPPPANLLKIIVEEVAIQHVELASSSSYQFNIYGDVHLTWNDARLSWDPEEWKMSYFILSTDVEQIWIPLLTDHGLCVPETGCKMKLGFGQIDHEGNVFALLQFQYPALCELNFKPYPEEENDCCIFFSTFEQNKNISIEVRAPETKVLNKPVASSMVDDADKNEHAIEALLPDHSAWIVTHRDVETMMLLNMEHMPFIKVCIHARKTMSTLRFALKLPILIATCIMLSSPLIGDLRMQIFIKLFVLSLQTICFLYLCSLTPPNGFGGQRPQIYTLYETIFMISFISIMTTLIALALSRVKRTVPPSHKLFLVAKLVNRVICCTEPDRTAAYQRYLDEFDTNEAQQRASTEIDYTQDWRHIYLAVNNCVSGFMLSLFVLIMLYQIF